MKTPRKSRRVPRLPSLLVLVVILLGASVAQFLENGELTWHKDVLQQAREFLYSFSNPSQPSAPSQNSALQYDMAGRAIVVTDGDTFTLRLANQRDFRIRLFGIDTPESDQAFGRAAGRALTDRILGKDVFIVLEDVDNYGRLVATVFTEEGNINLSLVEEGLAWWYRDFAADYRELADAESAARASRSGLWQDNNPMPPWEWRRR